MVRKASRRERGRSPPHSNNPTAGDAPSLTELEQFSQQSLRQWRIAAANLTEFHSALFFGLERERQRHSHDLIAAVQKNLVPGKELAKWARIVDYCYCLAPLSVAGSVTGSGGRFNIGAGLNPAAFSPFPALYIADSYATAFKERFGFDHEASVGVLSANEMALRSLGSFTHVSLQGQIELVLDIRDSHSLEAMANVLRQFVLPDRVRQLARRLGRRAPPGLVRSALSLRRQLIDPNWRATPVQFDLPSNSQIFGRIAVAAGAHGILFPSARQQQSSCMALFPQNWRGSSSFVEVVDGAPSGARLTQIDGSTPSFE